VLFRNATNISGEEILKFQVIITPFIRLFFSRPLSWLKSFSLFPNKIPLLIFIIFVKLFSLYQSTEGMLSCFLMKLPAASCGVSERNSAEA
jgi:hypothetical protein